MVDECRCSHISATVSPLLNAAQVAQRRAELEDHLLAAVKGVVSASAQDITNNLRMLFNSQSAIAPFAVRVIVATEGGHIFQADSGHRANDVRMGGSMSMPQGTARILMDGKVVGEVKNITFEPTVEEAAKPKVEPLPDRKGESEW